LEDHAENYTRFLVIARDPAPREQANKTSLMLSLGNTPGTLHRALGVFAARGLNLTKIESRPLPGRPWEYLFYLDVVDSGQGIGPALEEWKRYVRYPHPRHVSGALGRVLRELLLHQLAPENLQAPALGELAPEFDGARHFVRRKVFPAERQHVRNRRLGAGLQNHERL